MSTLTGKTLNLVKPELIDDHKVTIGTDLPANFQKIDDVVSAHLAESVTQKEVHGLKIESGTFTPILTGYVVAGVHTYSFQSGVYTRIGKRVFFEIFINLTAKDAAMSGAVLVKGLPFVSRNLSNYRASGSINYNSNIILDATKPYLSYLIINNQSEIALRKNGDNASNLAVESTQITNTTGMMLSGSYEIN